MRAPSWWLVLGFGMVIGCAVESVPEGRRGTRSSSSDVEASPATAATSPVPASSTPTPVTPTPVPTPTTTSTTPPPSDDPGPPPTGCTVNKDGAGFFRRTTAKGEYVGYVPASYDGSPTRLFVGLHGCGDNAYNFATWGVAPADTRATQDWIGISVEDRNGPGRCWDQGEDDVVLAAIADISKCFYVHQHKVVLGGFSSGGELAYGLGLRQASHFAGLLLECTTASAAGDVGTLAGGAAWKLPIAHVAHTSDSVFPLATVHNDWNTLTNAGFTVQKREVAGGHDGTSTDWAGWLLPKMQSWRSP